MYLFAQLFLSVYLLSNIKVNVSRIVKQKNWKKTINHTAMEMNRWQVARYHEFIFFFKIHCSLYCCDWAFYKLLGEILLKKSNLSDDKKPERRDEIGMWK